MPPIRRKLRIPAVFDEKQFDFSPDSFGIGDGNVPAKFKWNPSPDRPYVVANELICAEIGRFLRLPIPYFALTWPASTTARPMFSTLAVEFGKDFGPVDPVACVRDLPDLCAGIIAFDVLIANSDRHDENLLVDSYAAPRKIMLIDHGEALLGSDAGQAITRLQQLNGRLGISGGAVSQGNRHLFLELIPSSTYFAKWGTRIACIPCSFIESVCLETASLGLGPTVEEAQAACKFLIDRKMEICGLINRHHKAFKAVQPWVSA